jgi:hypothetical protein
MQNTNNLLEKWEETGSQEYIALEYETHLPLHDAARIKALSDMYPGRTESQIIADLLSLALDNLEESFPYVQGSKVVGEDEFGNPTYEDKGMTPRFLSLTKQHLRQLEARMQS